MAIKIYNQFVLNACGYLYINIMLAVKNSKKNGNALHKTATYLPKIICRLFKDVKSKKSKFRYFFSRIKERAQLENIVKISADVEEKNKQIKNESKPKLTA